MLDYLPDIISDLSAIHGIHDATRLEAVMFFNLARRLAAYRGMISIRLMSEGEGGDSQAAAQARRAEPAPLTAEAIADINARFGRREVNYTKVPRDA